MPNNFKNQKLAQDINETFEADEANLALSILEIVERSDGNPSPDDVRKAAQKCYEGRGE